MSHLSQATLDPPEAPTSADALAAHGLTGERVLKLAHRIATDAQHRAPKGLAGKYEDLVQFLSEHACQAAIKAHEREFHDGYSFTSYLCDIMEYRVVDFYRRKAEGFGDRRTGNDNRIVLYGDDINDFDTDYDFDGLLRDRRIGEWQKAADKLNMSIEEWLVQVADQAAARQLRTAA